MPYALNPLAEENTIVKKEHDPRPPEWCLGGIQA
jgi:hypothetical protein